MIEIATHNQILTNDPSIVSNVYEALLQPGVLSLHSSGPNSTCMGHSIKVDRIEDQ